MTIVFDARAGYGARIVSIKINGREAEDDGRYTIAGCEREGEPLDVICRHRGSHDALVLPMSIHEALGEYLKAHPVITPKRDGREKARDLPATVFSQDAVLAGGDLSKAATTPFGYRRPDRAGAKYISGSDPPRCRCVAMSSRSESALR